MGYEVNRKVDNVLLNAEYLYCVYNDFPSTESNHYVLTENYNL